MKVILAILKNQKSADGFRRPRFEFYFAD